MSNRPAAARHSHVARFAGVAWLAAALLLAPAQGGAITIQGVEFTQPVTIDATPGQDLVLSTSGDVYLFLPDGLQAGVASLHASAILVDAGPTLEADVLDLCTVCPLGPFDGDEDVLLRIFDPIGNLEIRAGGTLLVSAAPIPEPTTAWLLGAGLAGLSLRRRGRSGTPAPRPLPETRTGTRTPSA